MVSIYEPREVQPPGRIPPHNIEAEESLLGSMMLSRDALTAAVEARLEARDFYKPTHGHIFESAWSLHSQGEPVDPVTAAEELRRRGLLDAIGGRGELLRIQAATPASANASHYAQIVGELALLRRLIAVAGDIAELGYQTVPATVEETLDRAEQMVFDIAEKRVSDTMQLLYPALEETMDHLEQLYNRDTTVVGVPTGYIDLDDLLLGLQPSQLVVVAARPGQGKCVAAGTLLVDPRTGVRRTAAQLHALGRAGAAVEVLALDDAQRIHIVRPSTFVDDGVRPVLRVRTLLGRELTATACHPFLTPAGWRRLDELRAGAVVAVPRSLPVEGIEELPEAVVAVLAYATAFGVDDASSFPIECAAIADDLTAQAGSLGLALYEVEPGRFRLTGRGGRSRRLARVLAEHGASGDDLPPVVERLTNACLGQFLSRYLAASGGRIWFDDNGGVRVGFTAHGHAAAATVAHLLLRLGVVVARDGCSLEVLDDVGVEHLLREVGVVGAEATVEHVLSRVAARARVPSAIGRGPTRLEPTPSEPAVWWDDIVSIEPAGEEHVYDLSVPELHNFVAADVFVHNTSFALGAAAHVALSSRRPVIFFSMEMSHLELTKRLLSSEARVDARGLSTGRLSEAEWPKVTQAVGRLADAPFYIDDNPHCTVMEMRAKARRVRASHGELGLIVVDYLQLMSSTRSSESRQVEVAELSRGLKILARELEVPVLTLSQLNRQLEYRQDKRPMLADLRESGCLPATARIALAGGTEATLGDLYRGGAADVEVLTLDEHFRLGSGVMSKVFRTGVKPVYELRLGSGRRVRATANHPFLTIEGWAQLADLRAGDRVAVPRSARDGQSSIPGAIWDYLERKGLLAGGMRAHELISRLSGPGRTPVTYRDGVSRSLMSRIADDVGDPFLHDLASSDVHWDTVVRVARVGEAEVFDATVPGTHNFVADGVVVHNSIEQDADVVLFIYRDEYYNPESDQRGTAEIIVAKHRNGPTGTSRLAFLDHFTKFANMARQ